MNLELTAKIATLATMEALDLMSKKPKGAFKMKKPLTYKQRLTLLVNAAVSSMEDKASFPYGFEAYAKAAASCRGKRLVR